jgi:hypothetical protein
MLTDNQIIKLLNKIDSLVLPEYETGLGEIDSLKDELRECKGLLVLPAELTKSGKVECIKVKRIKDNE